MALLEITNFTYSYPRSPQPALFDINLKVEKGDFLGITGPTGAGKTTLACCLNGIIPHFHGGSYRGRVAIRGESALNLGTAGISRLVGSVFQDPEAQIICSEVDQELAFGLENLGMPPGEMEARIESSMTLAGIQDLRHRTTASLSGGQKQRVAIAAALAALPEILVLDEPTSELDPVGTEDIYKVLSRLNRDHGITVIIVEQKTDLLAAHAGRIAVMNQGRLAMEGSPREIFSRQEELASMGVRIPELARLAGLLGGRGKDPLPLTLDQGREFVERILRGERQ